MCSVLETVWLANLLLTVQSARLDIGLHLTLALGALLPGVFHVIKPECVMTVNKACSSQLQMDAHHAQFHVLHVL